MTATFFFFDDEDLLHRLAGEVGDLALEVTHARFTGVAPHERQQRLVVDRPLRRVRPCFLIAAGIRCFLAISTFSSSV